MSGSGKKNRLVIFQRAVENPDGYGGASVDWSELWKCWASFKPETGRETIEAGHIGEAGKGRLWIWSSSESREITTDDIVLIGEETYNIRSIINPDQRDKELEMVVEHGVAV